MFDNLADYSGMWCIANAVDVLLREGGVVDDLGVGLRLDVSGHGGGHLLRFFLGVLSSCSLAALLSPTSTLPFRPLSRPDVQLEGTKER